MTAAGRFAVSVLAALAVSNPAGAAPAAGFQPETGVASWYGEAFDGRKTANGESFDMTEMTAAHKTLPFGSLVLVTRLDDGRGVVVRINDRGPFVAGRIIDLSKAAALVIGLERTGTARVEIRPAPAGTGVGPYPAPRAAATPAVGSRTGLATAFPDSSPSASTTGTTPGFPLGTQPVVVRIQVGSYRDAGHASTAVGSLAALGLSAVVEVAGPYRRVAVYVALADRARVEALLDGAGWKDRLATEVRR